METFTERGNNLLQVTQLVGTYLYRDLIPDCLASKSLPLPVYYAVSSRDISDSGFSIFSVM